MIEEIDFNEYPHIPVSHKAMAREFLSIANDENEPPRLRAFMQAMLTFLLDGNADYEMIIRAASEMGYRLSEFPGDVIGRPADDYSDYEESA
jgi:hypothetical protein